MQDIISDVCWCIENTTTMKTGNNETKRTAFEIKLESLENDTLKDIYRRQHNLKLRFQKEKRKMAQEKRNAETKVKVLKGFIFDKMLEMGESFNLKQVLTQGDIDFLINAGLNLNKVNTMILVQRNRLPTKPSQGE